MGSSPPYLVRLQLKESAADGGEYAFSLPLIRCLDIEFTSPVTFFVGENGTGKSTVIEAIAAQCKLPVSGGGRNELAGNHGPDPASPLAPSLRPTFPRRPPDAYLHAEFQAHFASLLDARNADPDFRMWGNPYERYGGRSLHTRSHGEAFLAILQNRILIGAAAVRRARVRSVSSASTGAPGSDVHAHRNRQVAVHHRDSFANSPDIPRRANSLVRRRCSASHFPRGHVAFSDHQGILQNPTVYWKHLQESGDAHEEPVDTQPLKSKS
jgi:AAA domain